MTLDEAIAHCKEKAKELRTEAEQLRDIGEVMSSPKQPYNKPVKNCLECANEHEQLAEWLEELVERRETDNWISVSERLPEKRGVYIVTEKVFSLDDREHKGRYNTMVEQVEYCNGKWQRASFFEVIAWRPLPKPYELKKARENNETD